ncbi:MAG: hypothetical protein DIU68_002210 [Chloroflexota bacterium]|nr:MAG: hypothetical protein DIU68_13220 [Chloroflexota bacterium]
MMHPNMIQINQARMNDIMRAANRQRMARQALGIRASIWLRLAARIGYGMVVSGEYLIAHSQQAARNRRTAEHAAIKLA